MAEQMKNTSPRVDGQRARQGNSGLGVKYVLIIGIVAFAVFGFAAWFYFQATPNEAIAPAPSQTTTIAPENGGSGTQ
ncbi:hypothetical protein [Amorphus orientalis]|uniref:Uncharacterized protein n=1 Tax=Amorphus orientalis TaxID=649198 RepID=A0AAE4AS56_9HYPH|nr:hypothetical protein [Amorphus orientalis]MDQ0314742.1 hypothetical protein [Amorphus orientalis]